MSCTAEQVPPPMSALPRIVVTGFKTLDLIYFFTAGEDEVAAWIIKRGDLAPQAAGKIHTDFERGFISAEVVHYEDLVKEGSEAAAKASGKYRQQGKTYEVVDGDIIYFRCNTGAGLKKGREIREGRRCGNGLSGFRVGSVVLDRAQVFGAEPCQEIGAQEGGGVLDRVDGADE